jgi:hypothetical protein
MMSSTEIMLNPNLAYQDAEMSFPVRYVFGGLFNLSPNQVEFMAAWIDAGRLPADPLPQ